MALDRCYSSLCEKFERQRRRAKGGDGSRPAGKELRASADAARTPYNPQLLAMPQACLPTPRLIDPVKLGSPIKIKQESPQEVCRALLTACILI
jgi:hypothetical protein